MRSRGRSPRPATSCFSSLASAHPATNLQVVTTQSRRPQALVSVRARSSARGSLAESYFVVRFAYPDDEADRHRLEAGLRRSAAEARGHRRELYGPCAVWSAQLALLGARVAAPSSLTRSMTTARETTLRFAGNRELPAVYSWSPDRSESLVPKDVRGELVVVHAIGRELRLRRGGGRPMSSTTRATTRSGSPTARTPRAPASYARRAAQGRDDRDGPDAREGQVPGERTVTPVSGGSLDPNRLAVRRGIAVCALVAFGAFFIWGGWGRSKGGLGGQSRKAGGEPENGPTRRRASRSRRAYGLTYRSSRQRSGPSSGSQPSRRRDRPAMSSWRAPGERRCLSTIGRRGPRPRRALP